MLNIGFVKKGKTHYFWKAINHARKAEDCIGGGRVKKVLVYKDDKVIAYKDKYQEILPKDEFVKCLVNALVERYEWEGENEEGY